MGPSLSSALQPGQVFGRYQIARTLGVGSFGIVYEAVQYPLGRRVALKLLHDRTLTHPDAMARFEREAMAASRMRHDHIVDVYDFGSHEGTAFLAMELLEGESLQALMRRSGPLPQMLLVDLLLPIVSAVAAVHDQGIVHRDLKPENVLLTVTPERQWHPKLLDFGIAKVEATGPELTRTNALLGTPCYMSPEQVMQARTIDGRSDQWSLGVLLYEAVTGSKPFYSDTLLVLMTAITSETPPPPRVARPDLDAGFEAVILRAMQRRPEDRFGSMRELGAALLPFASPASQQRWYEEFANLQPRTEPRLAGAAQRASAVPAAPQSPQPPKTPIASFAVEEEEATRARAESVQPVDEPTELVNTTSQDGEFPAGFQRPQAIAARNAPPPSQGLQPPEIAPDDLFAPTPAREVGTGTLAMDLETAPGRASPVNSPPPPRPATGKMPAYKATVEMNNPVAPAIAPMGAPNAMGPMSYPPNAPGMAPMSYPPGAPGNGYAPGAVPPGSFPPGAAMGPQGMNPAMGPQGMNPAMGPQGMNPHAMGPQGMNPAMGPQGMNPAMGPQGMNPAMQGPWGAPNGYGPPGRIYGAAPPNDAPPNGTFNLTSGEIQRPPQRSSKRGLWIAVLVVFFGGALAAGVLVLAPHRGTRTEPATTTPPRPALPDASAVPAISDASVAAIADALPATSDAPALTPDAPALTPDASLLAAAPDVPAVDASAPDVTPATAVDAAPDVLRDASVLVVRDVPAVPARDAAVAAVDAGTPGGPVDAGRGRVRDPNARPRNRPRGPRFNAPIF